MKLQLLRLILSKTAVSSMTFFIYCFFPSLLLLLSRLNAMHLLFSQRQLIEIGVTLTFDSTPLSIASAIQFIVTNILQKDFLDTDKDLLSSLTPAIVCF